MAFKSIFCTAYAACLTVVTNPVSAALIDFQSLEHSGSDFVQVGSSYTEDGFLLEASNITGFGVYGTSSFAYTGSTTLFTVSSSASITLSLAPSGAQPGTFSFDSIYLAELNAVAAHEVEFTGKFVDGSTITKSVFLDGDGAQGFEIFSFTEFRDVISVTWSQPGTEFTQFDNIVVNAVPVPAAIWLFGSGLIGLVGFAKRKKA